MDITTSSRPCEEAQNYYLIFSGIASHSILTKELLPLQQLAKSELVKVDKNLQCHHTETKPKNHQHNHNQTGILPPVQFSQLLKISQHDLARKFRLSLFARSEREGNLSDSMSWKRNLEKEIKGNLETMRIEVRGLIELSLMGESRVVHIFYEFRRSQTWDLTLWSMDVQATLPQWK